MTPETSNPPLTAVGSYDLVEKIAEGGMGSIYKGRHRETGQIVAIKVMPRHLANNSVLLRRFEQEFRAASQLDHPNIVRGLDFGNLGNMPYLVMEYIEGESLGARLEREGRMPHHEAIRIIVQVAQGLHRAHKQNLIHRDVKPDNILVMPDGTAKLADLGLVKTGDAELNLTKTGRGLGTPHFMAPEQFRDAKGVDPRCDIYSLGATLYMMVTGELPFRSNGPLDAWMKKINNDLTPPRKIVPDLPERTEWAILRAMSPDRDNRPLSCREFVEDLTGHSTRRVPTTDSSAPISELWYLVYRDDEGVTHTVKGTRSAIRRSLKEGLLGDASNVRAARSKTGPFDPLRGFPEFRDLVVGSPALTPPEPPGPTVPAPALGPAQPPSLPGWPIAPSAVMPPQVRGPLIDLGATPEGETSPEWMKWLLLVLVAAASAAAALAFLPRLH
ncbi:MAG: serine/threonine protein kinase [Planctomycetes bacterium]|nr:serine/threonine protein kinase [Planctomycetota bacterium]